MKGLGGTSLCHRFTYPRCDKSVYFLSWRRYLLYMTFHYLSKSFGSEQRFFIQFFSLGFLIGDISETGAGLSETFEL